MSTKRSEEVYSKKYYKVESVVQDRWFRDQINYLRNLYQRFDIFIPKNGFKSEKQFEKWRRSFWKKRAEIFGSQKYKDGVRQFINKEGHIPSRLIDGYIKFRDENLPPIYSEIIWRIMRRYNLDLQKDELYDFLVGYIFFGKKHYQPISWKTKFTLNKKTKEPELYIQIFGHTRLEDIQNDWKKITKWQNELNSYSGKNKKYKNFERDREIYDEYLKLKSENKKGIDIILFNKFREKFGINSESHIRTIINRFEKRQ